jgi:hypothetical protein
MDSSLNDTNYDNIRPPDSVKRYTLIEDERSDFDKEIDEALYLSLQEIKQQEEINNQYEEEIIKQYEKEFNERKEVFKDLLLNLNKLIKLDKDLKEVYEIIEPVLDAYFGQYIETYEFDEKTYDKIFKTIGTLRINKKSIEILKTIIIKNCNNYEYIKEK